MNKLHLDINGEPLLRRTLNTYLSAEMDEIVVVLGHEHEKTRALLEGMPVRLIFNKHYREGQMTSVNCGLSALEQEHTGIFVVLSDQPAIRSSHVLQLKNAFTRRQDYLPTLDVAVPFFKGQRGNPIVMSNDCKNSILTGKRNLGCRHFIDKNPDLILRVDMLDNAVLTDLDTPDDYQNFTQHIGRASP